MIVHCHLFLSFSLSYSLPPSLSRTQRKGFGYEFVYTARGLQGPTNNSIQRISSTRPKQPKARSRWWEVVVLNQKEEEEEE